MPDGLELLWASAYCSITLVAWGRIFACISGKWVRATLNEDINIDLLLRLVMSSRDMITSELESGWNVSIHCNLEYEKALGNGEEIEDWKIYIFILRNTSLYFEESQLKV